MMARSGLGPPDPEFAHTLRRDCVSRGVAKEKKHALVLENERLRRKLAEQGQSSSERIAELEQREP